MASKYWQAALNCHFLFCSMDLNNKNNLLMKLFWLRVVKFDDIEVVLNKKVNSGFISALDIYISYLYMAYRRYFIAPQCILSGVIWVKD